MQKTIILLETIFTIHIVKTPSNCLILLRPQINDGGKMPNPYGRQLRARVVKWAPSYGLGKFSAGWRLRYNVDMFVLLLFIDWGYRSDIPVNGVLPYSAQGFVLTKGAAILGTNLEKTVTMLESEGYDLVMVWVFIIKHLKNLRG